MLTGGQVISEEVGFKLENAIARATSAGPSGSWSTRTTRRSSMARASPTDIQGRINEIKAAIDKTTCDYDREKLQERLAKLAGGVAVINVGAATETEMKEKKARVEDALHATRAAVEEGIVPGGGVALLRAQSALDKIEGTEDEQIGVEIVRRALEEPIRRSRRTRAPRARSSWRRCGSRRTRTSATTRDRHVRGSGQGGRHRPDEGHPHGAAERGVDRRPAAHHRVRGGREEGREVGRDRRRRRHGRDVLKNAQEFECFTGGRRTAPAPRASWSAVLIRPRPAPRRLLLEVAWSGYEWYLLGIPRLPPARLPHSGDSEMESSRASASVQGATALTRALCVLILLLMAVAAVYGACMALRNFRQIGV